MNHAQAYQAYQQNQVTTASPEKLVSMLYEGAIRFLTQAARACRDGKTEETHNNLVKAQAIVAELMSNVNQDVGEIGKNLFLLYDYMYQRLVQANVKKDAAIIEEVKEMVVSLRDTWLEAMQLAKVSQNPRTSNES